MVRDEEHRMELIPNGFDIIETTRRARRIGGP
jgi:hypothetical protein